MSKILEQSIIRTLIYFGIVKKALTRDELFFCLWQPPFVGREEFEKFLDEFDANTLWQTKDSLYFLRGHEDLIAKRKVGREHGDRLLKIAERAAKKLRSIPFVRAIFVCNSVGAGTANENSDIDFLIITTPKRIWIVRFFANVALLFSRMRRTDKNIADKVCLSFFIDEKNLNMAPWRVCDDDIHFAYWLYQMIPVYDPNNFYEKMLLANNWTKKYLPNIKNNFNETPIVTNSIWGLRWKNLWEKFWIGAYGDLIENQARGTQQVKMKFSSHGKVRPHNKSVIVGDRVIKLHETDTRERIHKDWLATTPTYNKKND